MNKNSCRKCVKIQKKLNKPNYTYIGDNYKGIVLIGESPHKESLISKSPFHNNKGNLLPSAKRIEEYLKMFGYNLENVALVQVSDCIVLERKNLDKMMKKCVSNLNRKVINLNSKVIISFGTQTLRAIETEFGIAGEILKESKLFGKKYIPLYHPSPINPNNHKNNLEFLKNQNNLI